MKQHITEEQFWELGGESSIGEKRLLKWMRSKGFQGYEGEGNYYFFLPTIGQMIEFLAGHELPRFSFNGGNAMEWWGYNFDEEAKAEFLGVYLLCDKLWEAVKEVLENKQKGLELTSP